LAFLLFLPVWLPPGQRTVGGAGGDPFFSSWFIRWVPYAISHGWNPLFTTYLDYPDGVNLMWNGSIVLPSLLVAPVTLTAGPMVAYNLLTTLGPALSGWCAYLALSRYVRSRLAAFIGGALYAFSPFMINQSLGHAHLTMAWAPPLALLLLDDLFVRRRRSLWIGVALGALGAAQLLTAEEVLAIVAVAAAVGLVTAGLLHRQAVWSRLRPALPVLGTAAVVFLVLAALPLGFQLFGPQRVHGPLQPSNYYVSDLLSFLLPTRAHLIAPPSITRISDHLAGFGEQTAYLGLPLIALLALAVRRAWHLPVVRWAAIVGGALALLSLGDTLHVAGADTRLPLPWALASAIPLVHEILPVRFSLVVFLMVGLLVAVFVDGTLATPDRRQRLVAAMAVGLSVAALFPAVPFLTSPLSAPGFFSRPSALHALPEGSVILVAPFAVVGKADAMYWQAEAGMWFRMPEGEAFVPSPYPLYPPSSATEFALVRLADGSVPLAAIDAAVPGQIRDDLRRWHVEAIVVGPMPHRDQAVALLSSVLGRAPSTGNGVDVWWDVPLTLAQIDDDSANGAVSTTAPARAAHAASDRWPVS
jgi:hypothetical protein